MFSTRSKSKAFTLIELLLVITIFAVMVAMLMPAVSRAKNIAIRVTCASNYRQLGVASTAFANDTRDAIPWLNTGSLGTLGYGGPYDTAASSIKNNELCQFSANYLNSPWVYSSTAGKFILPKVMIDPGLRDGMPRPYHGSSDWRPKIGSVGFYGDPYDGGTVLGFGSFAGLYMNGTGSGAGSNSGINARWRKRVATSISFHGAPGDGIERIRYSDMRYPSEDIMFLDLTMSNTTNAATSTNWCAPHEFNGKGEGSNHGYFDGSVQWADLKEMRYSYNPGSPWYFTTNQPTNWPMRLRSTGGPTRFNWGGYPNATWGWANTPTNWFGITTPNAGNTYAP